MVNKVQKEITQSIIICPILMFLCGELKGRFEALKSGFTLLYLRNCSILYNLYFT